MCMQSTLRPNDCMQFDRIGADVLRRRLHNGANHPLVVSLPTGIRRALMRMTLAVIAEEGGIAQLRGPQIRTLTGSAKGKIRRRFRSRSI